MGVCENRLVTIRMATARDVPALVDMGIRLIESKYAGRLAVNREAMAATASALIEHNDRARAFVAELDGEVVGMIGCLIFDHPLSGEQVGSEVCFWVNEEARGTPAALDLLDAAEDWWQRAGCAWWQMIAPDARVERLYERRKMVKIESAWQGRR